MYFSVCHACKWESTDSPDLVEVEDMARNHIAEMHPAADVEELEQQIRVFQFEGLSAQAGEDETTPPPEPEPEEPEEPEEPTPARRQLHTKPKRKR